MTLIINTAKKSSAARAGVIKKFLAGSNILASRVAYERNENMYYEAAFGGQRDI